MGVEGKSIIEILPEILKDGKTRSQEIIHNASNLVYYEEIIDDNNTNHKNLLYHGDNLDCIQSLINRVYKAEIDLIYIDPPFLTMANYGCKMELLNGKELTTIESMGYDDNWKGGMKEYLEMLSTRLYLMKELLSSKGSIYVHLDYRTVHYVKIIMDYIFGEDMFINEIIWCYKSGGVTNKYYSRKHDSILMYSKTKDYIFNSQKEKSYNREFKRYGFKGVNEYEDSIVADFFAGSGTTGVVAEKLGRRFILSDKSNISVLTIMKRIAENKGNPYRINKSKKIKNVGKLKIDSFVKEAIKEDKYLLKIKLGKYKLDLDNIKLSKKDKIIVKEILSKDSIALIDYIGLDLNYNGKNPNISYQYYRKKDYYKINNKIELIINKAFTGSYIYLKVLDVFGNEYSEILKI